MLKTKDQDVADIADEVKTILMCVYKVDPHEVLWLDYEHFKKMSDAGMAHIIRNYKLFWHPECDDRVFLLPKGGI